MTFLVDIERICVLRGPTFLPPIIISQVEPFPLIWFRVPEAKYMGFSDDL